MIVSHALKLIFIKPRKVAGTSLEIVFSKFAGPDDVSHGKGGICQKNALYRETFSGFDKGLDLIKALCRDEIVEYGYGLSRNGFGHGKPSKQASGECIS